VKERKAVLEFNGFYATLYIYITREFFMPHTSGIE